MPPPPPPLSAAFLREAFRVSRFQSRRGLCSFQPPRAHFEPPPCVPRHTSPPPQVPRCTSALSAPHGPCLGGLRAFAPPAIACGGAGPAGLRARSQRASQQVSHSASMHVRLTRNRAGAAAPPSGLPRFPQKRPEAPRFGGGSAPEKAPPPPAHHSAPPTSPKRLRFHPQFY